jgi:NitT/TauT family transport system substrate-binding protein
MEGNARLRKEPAACLPIIQTAFKWKPEEAKEQIASVHYANLPENLAFFQGSLDQAGSYTGIWQAAVTAYGREIIKSEVDPTRFLDLGPLKELESSGRFKDQVIAIAPINKGGKSAIEGDPLLSKDIRFFFQPNSAQLDEGNSKNDEYLDVMRTWLSVAPGSQLLLRGHVDPGQIETFRRQGGKELVDRMALQAKELSRQRAQAVKQALLKRFPNIEAVRLETVGLGWDEPADAARGDFNRRVEARWFTLE